MSTAVEGEATAVVKCTIFYVVYIGYRVLFMFAVLKTCTRKLVKGERFIYILDVSV